MKQGGRRLAAIMYTDIAGYTLLGQRDEALSLALVQEHRNLVRPILARHNGREVKTMGDSFLVEFSSAVEGVRCAFDIQRANRELNISLGEDKRIHLRIGIHLGEVVEDQGDILGDAVNVASRIEKLAEDGGVCLTSQVHDQVQGKVDLRFVSMGGQALKGVNRPMEVFRVDMPWEGQRAESTHGLASKRVVVLPFVNMSPDPNDEYFADGLTEELIDRLCQVRELEVIARTSAMSYKRKEMKARDIGSELRVGTLIEGSVRKAGSKVRITAKLVSADTEAQLWSSSYDRDLGDIFAVQRDIAMRVADGLRVQLLEPDRRRLGKEPTGNAEAYMDYLKARELLRDGSEQYLRQAVRLFESAIELDGSFAKAHLGLAECHQQLGNGGHEPWEEALAKAKAPLDMALALDPNLSEAHAALSLMHFNEDDPRSADEEARRAIELNPSLPEAYDLLANVASLKGEAGEAVRLVETCYRLDPIRPSYIRDLGILYFYTGREKEALQHWEKTAHLAPASTYAGMGEYFLSKKDYERAREFVHMVEEIQPAHPWAVWMTGFIAAKIGDTDAAMGAIRKIGASKRGAVGLNEIAFVYYALGNLDSYFDYLNRALDQHALNVVYMMWCPLFGEARGDSRFFALQTRVGNIL